MTSNSKEVFQLMINEGGVKMEDRETESKTYTQFYKPWVVFISES